MNASQYCLDAVELDRRLHCGDCWHDDGGCGAGADYLAGDADGCGDCEDGDCEDGGCCCCCCLRCGFDFDYRCLE